MRNLFLLALFAASLSATQQPAPAPPTDAETAAQVRQEFLHAWNAYKQYAWGHDELKPLSKSYRDWYGVSLYMTPVDSLDTLLLMGLTDEADKTRELIATKLTFDHDIYVKNFELTIRLLGGLLSGYQLTGDKRLLALADDLGKHLLPAFESPTGMPYMYVNLKTGKVRGTDTNPAEIGTLLIEFGTLSKLTGKPIYFEKAKRALTELYNRRSSIGLVGSSINVETGQWSDPTSQIGAGIDSYYEYLLKAWLLFDDKDCEKMWRASIDAVNKYLADDSASGLWYRQVNMYTGRPLTTHFGALDAFFPAILVRSGDLKRAARLQESAYKMWNTFGIEPEELDYPTMAISNAGYALRPEIIESAYYLHVYTRDVRSNEVRTRDVRSNDVRSNDVRFNDPRYQEMGRTFLDSLIRYCRTDTAYAALSDVVTKQKKDEMESFFFAETMKYLYLLYAPPETLDLKKIVFNTEAHPIRRTW